MGGLRYLWWLFTGSGTLLMFGAQVGPDEAVSNLSKWAKKAGWANAPEWLIAPSVDSLAFTIGVALFAIGAIALLWRWFRRGVLEPSIARSQRTLSEVQLRQLKANISEFENLMSESQLPIFWPNGPPDDPDAVDLAMQFKDFFHKYTKVKARTWPQRAEQGHSGTMVAVQDAVTPSREAVALLEALTKAGIPARYAPMPGHWESSFALFIGPMQPPTPAGRQGRRQNE